MPRNYTRKTTWGQTPLAEMESAAAEVMQGKKSLRKAGRDRNIDKTTLKIFIKKKEKGRWRQSADKLFATRHSTSEEEDDEEEEEEEEEDEEEEEFVRFRQDTCCGILDKL
ncbi:unnamed protein product [Pleuronectes platessa]|uniref:Uncharacterized protein n=1 Tax=Pleuronectes platessa TaxID=8262 RepID=A0A9N7ZCM5_PLEPL|nr:unnamed protein product [Pleuronectes platessa]